jgi:hypothetical protein
VLRALSNALLLAPKVQQLAIGEREREGGKHRAAVLAILLARDLRELGLQVYVRHLHAHLPRVLKAS